MVHAPARPPAGAPPVRINLYSDTQTRPTAAMREAMMAAEVGDEQFGDDPTVNELCDRMAALMGKEAAMFLPSGTMCNVVAILTHCRPGEEVLAHETAHILSSEGGVHAALAGVQINPLQGARGMFSAETLRAAIRPATRYAPPQRLLEVEQTANIGGGGVWPQAELDAVVAVAREQGWSTHMDGARLMNAVVASGIPAAEMVAGFDSVWLDFTKGLGAPLGAVLAGSEEFIGNAWRWKQRLGGSMRQAGICAAACIHALDHHIDRLAEDHANAKALARGLRQIPGMAVEEPDTNLVFFDPAGAGIDATKLVATLRMQGIQISMLGGRIRACLHLDVTATMVDETLAAIREAVAAA
ncbi:low specificity L-threonine aldolase [Pseudoroseomonas wenyumeiae]|uniref:Low specificity L-threonine aldolase n=1 Tax=Teichococcus wenyumeiae TaxID=2478470 RepID=A0A3A9JNN7_9PROT|nr:threonine aldolase family protein [Pseudoroseomonas wenyumeiae]RKK06135.1 low specificity L-threonine aldolase [Pseudoroseomonas wenyumeiae]RMI25624.1 low specificity L-threonine aldolase [Pseudoroseomonas wenyumeiae]